MAEMSDMQQLELHVQTCVTGSFTWVVRGQPVIAVFPAAPDPTNAHARDYTGQPSPHNAVPHNLLLWIGHDQAAMRLLVTLTQRIRVSSTRSSRLMFLIVPVETLTVEVHEPTLWTSDQRKLPLALFDAPSDVESAQASRLLQMSFSLGTECKSRVVMPGLRYEGDVSRHSLSLLRKLKALSESSRFDLFTNHNTWTQQGLLKAQQLLRTSNPVTPDLDLKDLYPGPRDGSWDNWEDQGWHDREECDLDKTKSTILRAKKRGRGRGTVKQVYKRHKQASPSPSTKPPPYRDSSSSSVRQSTPVHDSTLTTYVDCHVGMLPMYQAIARPTVEGPSALPPKSGSTTVLDLPEVAGLNECHNDLPTITSSCLQSCLASPLLPSVEEPLLDSAPSSEVPGTPIANLTVSSCDNDNLTAFSSDTEFCLLMPHLWSLCPDAHYSFIVELLKLGSATRTNAKEFRKIRVAFMNTFLSYLVTNRSSVPTSRLAILRRLDSEISSLLTWLSILDSTADMLVLSSLVRMAVLKQQLVQLGTVAVSDTEGYLEIVRMFQQTKSVVVTTACTSFGDRILKGERNIAVEMLQAKQLTSNYED